ncbi:MAG TPA: hydrogenase formation protein HypD [Phycisphaerales bacterium]|nr:hydrogenase formation protein HypD [Phycisphaerales bacterium]
MKYLDEFRNGAIAARLTEAITRTVTRPWTIMEVCGGQTHTIMRYGIDEMLPQEVELVHGPGCPVCVTSLEMIDKAHAIAARPEVIFCSFGDMLRVPGSRSDLLELKSGGADVRAVYSPLDAVRLAAAHPEREVVFFAIGFETTAPANAMAVRQAKALCLRNFSVLVSHVLVPPVITAILQSPGNRVQGFLGPGHVCTVVGYEEYEPIAARYRVPIPITGFEPVDMLHGVLAAVRQLEAGRHEVENVYARVVRRGGNRASRRLLEEVFEITDRQWRGMGLIPKSGYRLAYEYREFDAAHRFEVEDVRARESPGCISGQVLRGLRKPNECPAFGTACTPRTPLGATMVSSEGACAAYFAYGRERPARPTAVTRGGAPVRTVGATLSPVTTGGGRP